MKLYTTDQVIDIFEKYGNMSAINARNIIDLSESIELPSDEEIESRYNKFIDTEIKLGFLKQEQGERLKWYYKTYFIDKIKGGNNDQQ